MYQNMKRTRILGLVCFVKFYFESQHFFRNISLTDLKEGKTNRIRQVRPVSRIPGPGLHMQRTSGLKHPLLPPPPFVLFMNTHVDFLLYLVTGLPLQQGCRTIIFFFIDLIKLQNIYIIMQQTLLGIIPVLRSTYNNFIPWG